MTPAEMPIPMTADSRGINAAKRAEQEQQHGQRYERPDYFDTREPRQYDVEDVTTDRYLAAWLRPGL